MAERTDGIAARRGMVFSSTPLVASDRFRPDRGRTRATLATRCVASRPSSMAMASGRPPHHLLLGNDAFEGAMAKVEELRLDFTAGEAVARGADFPKAVA